MNTFQMFGELINVLSSLAIIPLTVMLCIISVFRIVGKKKDPESRINKWNKILRKKHIPLGITTIIAGGFHTVWASMKHGWFFSWGKVAFIILMLLLVSYLLRKKSKGKWMIMHRILTVAFLVSIAMHLVSIPAKQGGFPTLDNRQVQEQESLSVNRPEQDVNKIVGHLVFGS